MEDNKLGFQVKIVGKEMVVPFLPVQHHRSPLSNLDLLLPPVNVSVFFCYRKPTSGITFTSMICVLKKSLAKTLESYYPFAGEMARNSAGEPELLCNNRGVEFFEAFADIQLQQLDVHKPDEAINGKLLPSDKQVVLAIQATELKCGGVIVGCTFDHRVADAYSANMFFLSWSQIARLGFSSNEPSFCRSSLRPQFPLFHNPLIDDFYVPVYSLPPPEHDPEVPVSRIYYVAADQISQLQTLANDNNVATKMMTKIEAFSAFLWKIFAQVTKSNGNNSCRFGIVIDGRKRLHDSMLMNNYFGNVVSVPFGKEKLAKLKNMPLSWVANEVHKIVEKVTTREYFQGLIDYVEAYRPEPTAPRICVERATTEEPAFVVSSGQRFAVGVVDFGWGRPVFGCYYFPWGAQSGYVMPMPSASGNGDWVVYMHLLKSQIDAVETYASHICKPMKSVYLSSIRD